MDRTENIILRNLIYNEEYLRQVLPFIQPEYFNNREEKIIFEHIAKYAAQYNSLITQEILSIEIDERKDVTEQEVININQTLNGLENVDSDQEIIYERVVLPWWTPPPPSPSIRV